MMTDPNGCIEIQSGKATLTRNERLCEIGIKEDGLLIVQVNQERIKTAQERLSPEDLYKMGSLLEQAFYLFIEQLYRGRQ